MPKTEEEKLGMAQPTLRREQKHLAPQTEGRALVEKHWVLAFEA